MIHIQEIVMSICLNSLAAQAAGGRSGFDPHGGVFIFCPARGASDS
jgi:hypothetical protein